MGASALARAGSRVLVLLVLTTAATASVVGLSQVVPRGRTDESASGVPATFRPTRVPELGVPRARDSSGHHNDGIVIGKPVMGAPGHQGTAYEFDQPGSFILVPPDQSLSPGPHDFSYSAWVRLTSRPHGHQTFDIVRKGLSYTGLGEFKLEVVDGGHVRCTAKDDRGETVHITSAGSGLANDQWHHIGCARVGPTWNVVVDDVVDSKPATLVTLRNTSPVSIGSKYGREDLPRGRIDEVVIAISAGSASLPAPTVREGLRRLRTITPAGRWHLDESSAAER